MGTSFAPSGITDDSEIRTASSITDYIFRRLAKDYLSFDDRVELGLASLNDMPESQITLLAPEINVTVGQTLNPRANQRSHFRFNPINQVIMVQTRLPTTQLMVKMLSPMLPIHQPRSVITAVIKLSEPATAMSAHPAVLRPDVPSPISAIPVVLQ